MWFYESLGRQTIERAGRLGGTITIMAKQLIAGPTDGDTGPRAGRNLRGETGPG